jgi:ketosteroid isomerase-like protein
MSQENVEIAQEVLAAWNDEDLERWLGCWDPQCVWLPGMRGQMEGTQTYRGHEGLRTYWDEDAAVWHWFLVEVHEFRHNGPEVVAITTGTAQGRHSHLEISERMAFRFRLRNRKIVHGQSYLDVNEALEAVGLSE